MRVICSAFSSCVKSSVRVLQATFGGGPTADKTSLVYQHPQYSSQPKNFTAAHMAPWSIAARTPTVDGEQVRPERARYLTDMKVKREAILRVCGDSQHSYDDECWSQGLPTDWEQGCLQL